MKDVNKEVSSGHVVISPDDWNVGYALALAGIEPVPDAFTVRWSVVPRFVDEFISPAANDAALETTVTLAQGLANTKHTLEITGTADTLNSEIRIYRPAQR